MVYWLPLVKLATVRSIEEGPAAADGCFQLPSAGGDLR